MTIINIQNMSFYAYHGCFKEEQIVGTHFSVSLKLYYNAQKAIETDNIEDAVSYLEVYQVVKHEMEQTSHLIENVAWRIKQAVLQKFPAVESVTVNLSKLNPPLGGQVERVDVEL